jgi:putative transposase
MRHLHATSAAFIHQTTRCDLPVWWNFWDYCPRDEKDYRVRQNYLFNNPIKHGYVTDLKHYPYSTFHHRLEVLGRESLARQFREHSGCRELRLDEYDY